MLVYYKWVQESMKYISEFFVTRTGRSPVEEFLNSLDMRTQKKFLYVRSMLEEFGFKPKLPFCKYLKEDIYELRFTGNEGGVRVLYFFVKDNRIIFTNGFLKKTQKTPIKEIRTAVQRKKIFLEEK